MKNLFKTKKQQEYDFLKKNAKTMAADSIISRYQTYQARIFDSAVYEYAISTKCTRGEAIEYITTAQRLELDSFKELVNFLVREE